ncbi:MAG: putative adenylyltransferase/sulfurtransferase MoeZ [Planctomycetota bacterium]|jgi:adenylyltransferase/sulfurtransferase
MGVVSSDGSSAGGRGADPDGVGGLPPGYPFRADDERTPRAVKAALEAGSACTLVDVRTTPEWDICHIEGARLLPLQELERRVDELKADLDDDLSRPIVVYCHHGRRSLTATYMLRAAGFTDVRSLAGGIHLWAQDIDRTMATY